MLTTTLAELARRSHARQHAHRCQQPEPPGNAVKPFALNPLNPGPSPKSSPGNAIRLFALNAFNPSPSPSPGNVPGESVRAMLP